MGKWWSRKKTSVEPLKAGSASEEHPHDPQLEFMYKIVRMINKSGNDEKRGEEIDKEICRVLSSNDEIFDAVICGKKTINKKTMQCKTKKVKLGGTEDEIETFAVMTEDQYIINVFKTHGEEEKARPAPMYKVDLGSVRISKNNSTSNTLLNLLEGKTQKGADVTELRKRFALERRLTIKAKTAHAEGKRSSRFSTAKIEAIIKKQMTMKAGEENRGIISLPQWSIYLSSIGSTGIPYFGYKLYEIYIDGQQLDSMSYLEFDTFGYICCKGLSPSFLQLNQDFLIVKNAAKNINYFSVVDGHGSDCQQFHDTLKLYTALMILGDKALPNDPASTITKAFSYIQALIEEAEETAANNFIYSSLATCFTVNDILYVVNIGDVRCVLMYEVRNEIIFKELSQLHDLSVSSEVSRVNKLEDYKVETIDTKKYVVPREEDEDDTTLPKSTLTRFISNDNKKFENSVFSTPFVKAYNITQYSEPLLLIGTKSFWLHFESLKEDLCNIHRHLCDANNQYDFQAIVEDLYKKVQLELTDSQLFLDTTFIFAKLF